MTERQANPAELRKLRLRELCRDGGEDGQTLHWQCGYDVLPRLAATAQAADATAQFEAALTLGEHALPDGTRVPHAELAVGGDIALVCQRCLEPYVQPLASRSAFVLVDSEAAADALFDATSEDDEAPEPLVADRPLDAITLMEDELLLALPLVPRHATCPDSPATRALARQEGTPSPFAVLTQLKKG